MHRTARGPSPGALITAACLGAAEEEADGEEREDRAARLDGRKRRSGVHGGGNKVQRARARAGLARQGGSRAEKMGAVAVWARAARRA